MLRRLFLLCIVPLLVAFNFPAAHGYVTDAANLIEPDAEASLEKELGDLQKGTGWEVAVVTVPNMEGGTVERYAQDLFVSYGIGKKGTDNGVLLLVAREERKIRIHTGYHAESVVTDAQASRIIHEVIAVQTKQEHWSKGVVDGAHAIVALVHDPGAKVAPPSSGDEIPDWAIVLILAIVIILFIIFATTMSGGSTSYSSSSGYGGSSSGGGGSFFSSGGSSDSSSDSSSGSSSFGGFGGGDSGGGGASGDA